MSKIIGSDVIHSQLGNIVRNPKASVRVALDLLENLTDGEVVMVDASNPFAYSLEMAAVSTSYGLLEAEALARRLYPSMAKTQEDIYLHMADEDYLDRFATPAETVIGFVMPLQEVLGKAVPIYDGTGAKALVIPRHTSVTVGNITLTLQYPVVIKVMFNGTISVTMDLTRKAPTFVPPTNIIRYIKQQIDGNDWIVIDVPVQQVKITSHVLQLTSFTGYAKTFSFDDQFYYARAFIQTRKGTWEEIHVTHQQQVYNANQPTVCLKVLNQSVEMYIPQIYYQNGLITGTVRLDIYTTLGKLDEDLGGADISTFKLKFTDLDTPLTEYSSPFTKFTNISAITRTAVRGGSSQLTFSELHRRVTARSTFTEGLPITQNQLGSMLRKHGYEMITNLDNITNRQYVATRQVDPPKNKTTVTGLGCSMQLVELTLSELGVNDIMFNMTKRATLKPSTLLIQDGHGVRLVSDERRDELRQIAKSTPDGIVNIVNNTQYHFTPFHYVFDMSLETFNVRPYYLSSPKIKSRFVFQQNDGLGLNLRSEQYGIHYNTDGSGYRLVLSLENNASINSFRADQIDIQLSYVIPESTKRAWLKGTLITPVDTVTGKPLNNQWYYAFDIHSTFDINNHNLMDVIETGFPLGLTQEFDVLMVVKDYLPTEATFGDIDLIVSKPTINNYDPYSTYIGASQEKITVEFGVSLDHLWRRSRTVVDEGEYRRYEEDVMEYWTKDFYKTDASGNIEISYNYETSEIITTKIHSAGDPILDPEGNPVFRHRKGDIMLDSFGEPIPLKGTVELKRQVDLFLVDGRYFFADNESSVSYLNESLNTITSWINNDIANMQKRCLERTDLYFYPRNTTGMVDVIVGDGTMVRLKADQSLRVIYTLRKEKYKNTEIRESLVNNTASLLDQALNTIQRTGGGVLTKNAIVSLMKELLKDDIVDLELKGFLGDQYQAVLLSDVSSVPTIGKRLVTLSNLTLQVRDDVDVDFEILDQDKISPYTSFHR